jgi:hypothetical protein
VGYWEISQFAAHLKDFLKESWARIFHHYSLQHREQVLVDLLFQLELLEQPVSVPAKLKWIVVVVVVAVAVAAETMAVATVGELTLVFGVSIAIAAVVAVSVVVVVVVVVLNWFSLNGHGVEDKMSIYCELWSL